MKIKSGEYEVIFSGTIIGIINEEIEFQFPDTHASLKIIFAFKTDKSTDKSPIEFDFPDEKSIRLTLVNIDGTFSTGNTELLEIGFLDDRKLYLNYRVHTIKDLSNTLHYSFYLGKEGSYVK